VFLLWVVGCCGWIGTWLWHYGAHCRLARMGGGRALSCNWQVAGDGAPTVMGETEPLMLMVREIIIKIQIPLCALVVGLVVYWAVLQSRARVKSPPV
jgi:hypothetical protein